MRSRSIFSLISIVLATALVIGGFSLAWFTDKGAPSTRPALSTGTVDFEIVTAELVGSQGDEQSVWEAGESKDFFWAIENTGSKAALYRAKLIETVQSVGKEETAWGEGTRFRPQGNWGMYFIFDQNPKTVRLIAGQHFEAGTVEMRSEDGKTYVTLRTNKTWKLVETHVHVADNLGEFTNPAGNPVPGQFRYKDEQLPMVEQWTYEVTDSMPASGTVYVAVHAVVVASGEPETAEGQIEWSLAEDAEDEWKYHEGWWYYCGPPVGAGETVSLKLTGRLPDEDGVESGCYTVILKAEAVQATNDAIKHEWWSDYPGR